MARPTAAARLDELLKGPHVHRGMAQLDRALFAQSLDLLAVVVPSARVAEALNVLKGHLLRREGLAHFADHTSDPALRLMILLEDDVDALPRDVRSCCAREGWPIQRHRLPIPYEYWTASEILRAILPEEVTDETPSSFARVGHIAHLNLRDEYLPYRHVIGAVVLDKNPGIRTVVNKLDTIDNEFRFFKMEVLAGDEDFIADLREQNCRFRFDFSKVYWNTRLSTEHGRLVDSFAPTDVVVDAFAGVGPFAIPAAKKGCAVLASDLNPASAEALASNVVLNKAQDRMRAYQLDARDFIRRSVGEVYEQPFAAYTPPLSNREKKAADRARREQRASTEPVPCEPPLRFVDHFVMNLPATALEFIDAYRGLYDDLLDRHGDAFLVPARARPTPLVHCYCFSKAEDAEGAEREICERATAALGQPVSRELNDFALSYVRSVAPRKTMYRLSFRLPWAVLASHRPDLAAS